MSTPSLNYDRFFEKGSLRRLMGGADVHDFAETWSTMRRAFGYQLHHVNFGYWPQGVGSPEPGRALTYHMGEALGLSSGDRVLEAGARLGQASADLCERFSLGRVQGFTRSDAEARFANALAQHAGVADRVQHRAEELSQALAQLQPGEFTHGFAQECVGRLPDPQGFFRQMHRLLPPGGRLAITVVTSPNPPSGPLAKAQRLFAGVVPKGGEHWQASLQQAGFSQVRREDITAHSFTPLLQAVRANIKRDPKLMPVRDPISKRAVLGLLSAVERGVKRGTMGYELLVATR